MATTYTGGRTLFGNLTNNNESSNLTFGDTLINNNIRTIVSSRHFTFRENSGTKTTGASQQFYTLPYDFLKLISVKVTVSSTDYTPKEAPSQEFWNKLNMSSVTSNIPEWYYVFNGQLGLYPKPSTAGNTITYYYERAVRDLSIADYTTGTILTASATAITGIGNMSWTSQMAGRYLNITLSNTTNTGDGYWYEVDSVTNTANIVLKRTYGGTAISAGAAAYTIGQTSILPEDYQALPIYKSAEQYWTLYGDTAKAQLYKGLCQEMYAGLVKEYSSKSTNPVIEDIDIPMINPNLFITGT